MLGRSLGRLPYGDSLAARRGKRLKLKRQGPGVGSPSLQLCPMRFFAAFSVALLVALLVLWRAEIRTVRLFEGLETLQQAQAREAMNNPQTLTTTVVTPDGITVVVTTTCLPGESYADCAARHLAMVRAVQAGTPPQGGE